MNRQELHKAGWIPVGDFDNLEKIAYVGMMLTYSVQALDTYFFTAIIESTEPEETEQVIGEVDEDSLFGDVGDPIIQTLKALPIYITDRMEHDAISMTYTSQGDVFDSLDGWYYMPKQITNDPIGKE